MFFLHMTKCFVTLVLADATFKHVCIDFMFMFALGDVKYASGTYRIFKLPQHSITTKALVTYKGTVPDCEDCFEFDSSHSFKVLQNKAQQCLSRVVFLVLPVGSSSDFCCVQTNVPVEVGAEMAAILQHTRFSTDFNIVMLDIPDPNLSGNPQVMLSDAQSLSITSVLFHHFCLLLFFYNILS